MKGVFNYFLITSVLVGFIFIISTLTSNKGRDKSIIYLNLVVTFLVLNYLQIVLLDNVFTEANYFVTMLRIPFYALILPAYYTFVTFYLGLETKITSYVFFSLSLFLIEIAVRVILFQEYYYENESYVVAKYRQVEEIVNIIFSLYLFVKAFVLLFKRQKLYQYILTFDNLKWLKKFMFISTIIMISWITAVVFNFNKVINPEVYIFYPLRFSCSILVFWLGFYGLSNYSILTERIKLREEIINDNSKKRKEIKNTFTFKSDKFQLIENYIQDNLCYLDPNYSLDKLSIDLKMSTSLLSQTINSESKTNFSDYINSLRVKKAKELLTLAEFKNYTIIAIGLECGFNSKSTFYLSFKKFTNTTPTEYRNKKG